MRNYILVLFAVLGVGILTTPGKTKAETATVPVTEEIAFLDEIEPFEKAESPEIAQKAEKTEVVLQKTVATNNVAPSVINYNVVAKSQITKDPGNTINLTRKAVWGHNDPNLLLNALSMTSGKTFTVTEQDGNVTEYKVSHTEIYSVAELEEMVTKTRNRMYYVAYLAQDRAGSQHDIILFTCYERTRDAEHRFVVFADKI